MNQSVKFKELRVESVFYFASENEWWSRGMPKGPFVKISTRKYQDTQKTIHHVGSINVDVLRIGG